MATKKPNLKNKGKVKQGILTSKDIMRGFTTMVNQQDIWTLAPVQTVPLEDKTEDWIKWNADWFENIALRELPKKAKRIQKLYNMAAGVINKSDYIYVPGNDLYSHLDIIGGDTEQTLLEQFFPIAPNILNVFLSKYLTSERKIIVDAVDPESKNEAIDFMQQQLYQVYENHQEERKQLEMIRQGIIPGDPATLKIYEQEMQMVKEVAEADMKFKKFRTQAAQWGQHFIEKYSAKTYFEEEELKMFRDSLIADESIIALNLYEDDFTPEVLRTLSSYANISPNKKYYSQANFVVNIEFMSIPEIINAFRNKLNDEQIQSLENQYSNVFSRNIMFADEVGRYSSPAYYDPSKSDDYNMQFSVNIRENQSDKAVENFILGLTDQFNSANNYTNFFNNPKMIRVSRIWWPSQRKEGLLTKIEEDGSLTVERIDENFIVTEKPKYDNSLLKEKSAKTVISGEHVDWTYVTEWRYVVKIGENRPYYSVDTNTEFENIYLYGEPIPFQFIGKKSHYGAKPPLEGCRFTDRNTVSVSLMEKIRPWQILYNVANNKATKVLPYDYGKVLLMNSSTVKRNSLLQEDGIEPLIEYMRNVKETKLALIDDSRETASETTGRLLQPTVADMSTVDQAMLLIQLGIALKQQAFESIGVSPAVAAQGAGAETATGVQQDAQATANQIEPYFDQFSNKLMPRVWQMILEAAQYYTTKSEDFSDTYINDQLHKQLFGILKMDLLLRDLLVMPFSKVNLVELVKQLKQLAFSDNTLQASILERAKVMSSSTPSEILEKLEEEEDKRNKQEQQKYEQEKQLQLQQQQFLTKQHEETVLLKDKEYYAGLANDRYIAELKVNSANQTTPPQDSPVDVARLQQEGQQNETNNQLAQQKINQDNKNNNDKNQLERDKLATQERVAQLNYETAVENKSSSDLRFIQLQKNKSKEKSKKK